MCKYAIKTMLIYEQSNVVIGCEVKLVLVSKFGHTIVDKIFNKLWLELFTFEKRCSRFLPQSELSQFNRAASTRQTISGELRDVLIAAYQMAELTAGLYNPFVLPALQRAGYVQSMVAAHAGDEVDDFSERTVTSYDHLEIGDNWARIPYGTAIDLGGCGKGYIADRLAQKMHHRSEIAGYWFSLGGDVIAGGLDHQHQPWKIWVEASGQSKTRHAFSYVGYIQLEDGSDMAIATSAITYRRGQKHGKSWHHIIDPRTNEPARSDILSATIADRSALKADVLASCVIIEGSGSAHSYVNEYNIDGLLIQTKQHTNKVWGIVRSSEKVVYES